MIVINRGKEPDSLLEFRLQHPEADYEDMPSEVKDDVREQMWLEQKHLCGYCMRKINNPENVRIEHCRPRHPQGETEHDKSATLDFKWMIGVCYGNSLKRGVKKEDMTCDAHKGNAELTVNPYSEASIRKIKYRSNGRIYSDDPDINRDVTETLNLNCEAVSLPQTRRKVLEKEKSRIFTKCEGKSQTAVMRELERTYASLVQERNLTPYCGIIISWLEGKLKIS
ncbi:MAG: TIGR02646 family protein [Lachnospiraceae bacterium]|nr:TIGR02646 family protein [Lachnospiraceae bacterium]